MGQRIIWTPASAQDLEDISRFISRDSQENAAATIQRIIDAIELAADFPLMHPEVHEFREVTIREVVVYSYRIIYRVRPGAITIGGVIHGARQLKRALKGRGF